MVWATTPANNDANRHNTPGILRAFDADDLQRELWNSYQQRERDDFGNFAKHTPPTIANGKVYVATFSYHLSVYGLHLPFPSSPSTISENYSFEEGGQRWEGKFRVNNALPYHGSQQGVLCPNQSEDADVLQRMTVPVAGRYTLTAYCATNILEGNAIPSELRRLTLLVSVNGRVVAQQSKIVPFVGYQPYSLSFSVSKGATVAVRYYAPRVQSLPNFTTTSKDQPTRYAVIDNITLSRALR